ncbi:MAG: PD-(D/E)XK nuclease family protein [Lachnospiraceae bacterium]
MGIHIINGPAGCGKSYYLYDYMLKKAEENSACTYILVVPEQAALSAEKELVEKSSGKGIMNIEVLSFTRLAYRIMEEAGDSGYPMLNDMGKSMLIRKVMQEKRSELRLYAGKEKNAGFLDEIKSMISEFSQYLISPEMLVDFSEKGQGSEILSIKLKDMSVIYGEFLAKIKGVYTTAETMFELSYKHIPKISFLKTAVLVFDGFTGFTPSQYAFVEQLLSVVNHVYLCVTMDNELIGDNPCGNDCFVSINSEPGIFSMSSEMADSMIKLGKKNGLKTELVKWSEYQYLSEEISFIRDNIFRNNSNTFAGESHTVITAHGNRKQEAFYIASRISELLRDENLHYSDIGVIAGDLPGYAPYFEKAFRAYGIDCYIDETRDISSNALVEFIGSILNSADSEFKPDEIAGLIKSPLAGYDKNSIWNFENYLLCYGYRGRNKYNSEWTANKKIKQQVDLVEINRMRTDLFERLSNLPKNNGCATTHEIIVGIYQVLTSYEVKEKLLSMSENLSDCTDSRYYGYSDEYSRVYDAVMGIFQQMDDLMGNETCTYKEFYDIFMTGVRKTKLGILPPKKDVVMVGDVLRTRIHGIKVLFFAGVNENIVPSAPQSGGILTDEEREAMGEAGCKIAPGVKDKTLNEEFYIYLAISKPRERLYISYALTGDDGKEAKPSYIVNILSSLTGVKPCMHHKNGISDLAGFDRGLSYVTESIAKNKKAEDDSVYSSLLTFYKEGKAPEAEIIRKIIDDYYTRGTIASISKRTADRLYNHILLGSVSRMETYAECAYKFFMEYGLGLKSRPESGPDNLDYGSLFHDAMRRYGEYVKNRGNDWQEITPDICKNAASHCFDEAVKNYGEGIYREEAGSDNLTERMKKVMISSAEAVTKQLQAGEYKPEDFEFAFNIPGQFINLRGVIDRADICRENGVTRLKIVDYKTGNEKIDYVKLYYGIQIQLMVYLNAMLYSDKYKDAVPSGVFYQKIDDPEIDNSEKSDVNLEKLRELRPYGIITDDHNNYICLDRNLNGSSDTVLAGSYSSDAVRLQTKKNGVLSSNSLKNIMNESDLRALASYAGNKVNELSNNIMNGDIKIFPYKYDKMTACEYCQYSAVCGFDKKNNQYRYNYLDLKPEEALERMVK